MDLNSTGPIVHNERLKLEGKTLLFGSKSAMVRNVLFFKLFIEKLFRKVGFFYSLKRQLINTIPFCALEQVY